MKYGARHLKRAIDRSLVHPLSNLIATEQVRSGDLIKVDYDGELEQMTFFKEAEDMPPYAMMQMLEAPVSTIPGPAMRRRHGGGNRLGQAHAAEVFAAVGAAARGAPATIWLRMPIPAERRDLRLMRAMFSTIAPRYDFITRMFSYGMDRRWKRRGVEMAGLPERAMVLDLASGTGDFSQLVVERCPQARSIAVDLTEGMLRLARDARHSRRGVRRCDRAALCRSILSTACSSATVCAIFRT